MVQLYADKQKLTIALHGGVGNQLFQYAYARALSLHMKRQLIFDQYGFNFDKKFGRTFSLDYFEIPKDIGNRVCKLRFQTARALRNLKNIGSGLISIFKLPFFIEFSAEYYPTNWLGTPLKDLYVFGYWQDERYFEQYANQIRKDLTFKPNFSHSNLAIATQIQGGSTPISLHVRRLHQVGASEQQVPKAKNGHNEFSISQAYYKKAIELLEERFPMGHFFVFSDFPEWAKENIHSKNQIFYLESGRGSDLEDLHLMSLCKHHIIANSSFSWWGAWLAKSKDQVIIAPKAAPLMPKIPAHWLTIDA